MELRFSPLSPYARKVLVVAHEIGVVERMRLVRTNPRESPEELVPLNPLGKIPVLVTDGGEAIHDSPVICEFLDAEYGGRRLLPAEGPRRWQVLTTAALADGVLDAAVLVRHERLRPAERQSAEWMDRQLRKVHAGLDRLEELADSFNAELDLGQIGVGCVVGYVPLRLEELQSLERWRRLRAWYAAISLRPSFERTKPVP